MIDTKGQLASIILVLFKSVSEQSSAPSPALVYSTYLFSEVLSMTSFLQRKERRMWPRTPPLEPGFPAIDVDLKVGCKEGWGSQWPEKCLLNWNLVTVFWPAVWPW